MLDYRKLASMTDDVADRLEASGYVEEAAELDGIANAFEKAAARYDALQVSGDRAESAGIDPHIFGKLSLAEKVHLGKWLGAKADGSRKLTGELLKSALDGNKDAGLVSYILNNIPVLRVYVEKRIK